MHGQRQSVYFTYVWSMSDVCFCLLYTLSATSHIDITKRFSHNLAGTITVRLSICMSIVGTHTHKDRINFALSIHIMFSFHLYAWIFYVNVFCLLSVALNRAGAAVICIRHRFDLEYKSSYFEEEEYLMRGIKMVFSKQFPA